MNNNDQQLLSQAKYLFYNDREIESYKLLNMLCAKYDDNDNFEFITDLYVCNFVCVQMLGINFKYSYILDKISTKLDSFKCGALKYNFIENYINFLLSQKRYVDSKHYIKYQHIVTGPFNINVNTISYLKEGDKDKCVLFYCSGGLGDIIMHARFLSEYCEKNKDNKIILMSTDNLFWIFKQIFTNIPNLSVISKKNANIFLSVNKFDHHSSIDPLCFIMNKSYEDIVNNEYLKNIRGSDIDLSQIIHKNKKNIIINWCGSKENPHELRNRSISLKNLSVIFQNNKINWISIQKDVNKTDEMLLKKYDIMNLAKIIDNRGKAFYDTVSIMKKVDLVISTDTSIVHLAGSMGIPTICLLTVGANWRWTKDTTTNWYPNVKLLRQNSFRDWSNVITELIKRNQGFLLILL